MVTKMNFVTPYVVRNLFIITLVALAEVFAAGRNINRGVNHNLHYLDPPGEHNLTLSIDEWFDQRLDHFNAQNTKTWKQRYFSK